MLTVQWQSPQDDGGAPVSYTITVSPGVTQVTTNVTSTSLSAIPYNVNYTVSIVATNCIGNSSAIMETIRIGRLQLVTGIMDTPHKIMFLLIFMY